MFNTPFPRHTMRKSRTDEAAVAAIPTPKATNVFWMRSRCRGDHTECVPTVPAPDTAPLTREAAGKQRTEKASVRDAQTFRAS